ncbi:MAG TPA: NADH-quinone oxidoreductase subunit C, partial [Candidatus Sulfotelmatobacter sp.]|nr:NADH-quinone oxidoreductase subunit C [Candidatus Sulfotelmatobacter sp.]
MHARERLTALRERFGPAIRRADLPGEGRLLIFVERDSLKAVCRHVSRDLGARYVTTIGADDRPFSGRFLVVHNFAFDRDHLIASISAGLPADDPRVDSICEAVPAANWAEREMRDLVGIVPQGHRYLKRLVLPDGWPDGVHPLRKDVAWNYVPPDFDEKREFTFGDPPEGSVVVPFGPFHPTLDEPAHFRLYVEGEMVRGCEYRGFMAHRGIEKLAESVMTYNEIPLLAERICGICGCVHSVAYVQAVESAAALQPPPRAEYLRTIMLEIERLQSHLLSVGLACHIVGFDTLFMQCFRIREPVMRIAEAITGNRKTYALCVVGGVRWDLGPELKARLLAVLDKLEAEWRAVDDAVTGDRNLKKRTVGVGVTSPAM